MDFPERAKKINRYKMRIYRDFYLSAGIVLSLLVGLLAFIALFYHQIRLSIFVGLIIVSLMNLGIHIYLKKQILDALVELEIVLEASKRTHSDAKLRSRIAKHHRPGTLDKMVAQIEQTINSEYTSKLLRTQAEIHALQSQINPHFLYNTLETIRSQAIVRQVPEIEEMAEALATIFRYGISSQGEMSTLAKELKCVQNYFVIQQHRFQGRYRFVSEMDESNELLMKCQIPILTIQPIIENAIVHGLESKLEPGTITLRAELTQSHVYVHVSDDGIGMSESALDRLNQRLDAESSYAAAEQPESGRTSSGIALNNVNQRIKYFFGPDYGISVTSTIDVGTTVDIILPNKQ